METEIIFKIAGIGIVVAIVNMLLAKTGRDEYMMLTTLAGIIIVVAMMIEKILEFFSSLEKLFGI